MVAGSMDRVANIGLATLESDLFGATASGWWTNWRS